MTCMHGGTALEACCVHGIACMAATRAHFGQGGCTSRHGAHGAGHTHGKQYTVRPAHGSNTLAYDIYAGWARGLQLGACRAAGRLYHVQPSWACMGHEAWIAACTYAWSVGRLGREEPAWRWARTKRGRAGRTRPAARLVGTCSWHGSGAWHCHEAPAGRIMRRRELITVIDEAAARAAL
jgi:hypothetical protein